MYKAIGKRVKQAFRHNAVMEVLLDAVDSGPFDGGCLIVAKALRRIMPECKLCTVLRRAGEAEIADHYVLLCPDGGVMDADGWARDSMTFIRRFMRNEKGFYNDNDDLRIEPRYVVNGVTPDDLRAVEKLEREIRVFFSEE